MLEGGSNAAHFGVSGLVTCQFGCSVTERRVLMLLRQVDELQEQVEKLKAELAAKEDTTGSSSTTALELENSKHLELIAELKVRLEQVHWLSFLLDDRSDNWQARVAEGC